MPTLIEGDGWLLTQAGAILDYLAAKHPEADLAGGDSLREVAEAHRWSSFFTGDLHPSFYPIFMPQRYTTSADPAARDAVQEAGRKLVRKQPPEGFISWTEETFTKLIGADPEPLASRMRVTHGTLLNVIQQSATSIGTAVISVILASSLASRPEAGLAIMANTSDDPLPPGVPNPLPESFFETAADVFSSTFTISVVLIVLTLIPAFFLPRKKIASPLTEEDMDRGPIMMH